MTLLALACLFDPSEYFHRYVVYGMAFILLMSLGAACKELIRLYEQGEYNLMFYAGMLILSVPLLIRKRTNS